MPFLRTRIYILHKNRDLIQSSISHFNIIKLAYFAALGPHFFLLLLLCLRSFFSIDNKKEIFTKTVICIFCMYGYACFWGERVCSYRKIRESKHFIEEKKKSHYLWERKMRHYKLLLLLCFAFKYFCPFCFFYERLLFNDIFDYSMFDIIDNNNDCRDLNRRSKEKSVQDTNSLLDELNCSISFRLWP